VKANLIAASTPRVLRGEVVNVACGERTSLNQLLRYVGELAGKRLVADYRPQRQGDVRDSLADVSAARTLLGYEPMVDVREGLKRTYEAFVRRAK
jgi:nucleoside-diphosphate-sugar epimerase